MELSSVARFYDYLEAEIAAGLLRATGVPCLLSGEAAASALPVRLGRLGRVEVLVRAEDADRAERLLADVGTTEPSTPPRKRPSRPRRKTTSARRPLRSARRAPRP